MAVANDRGEAPSEPITVEITAGPVAGEVVSKRSQKVTVGRTKKSHVAIKDSAVSQKHAEFRWTGCWCLTDCGSSNGTFLNGEQISEDGQLLPSAPMGFVQHSTLNCPPLCVHRDAPVKRGRRDSLRRGVGC